jgi:hypothetical protein
VTIVRCSQSPRGEGADDAHPVERRVDATGEQAPRLAALAAGVAEAIRDATDRSVCGSSASSWALLDTRALPVSSTASAPRRSSSI